MGCCQSRQRESDHGSPRRVSNDGSLADETVSPRHEGARNDTQSAVSSSILPPTNARPNQPIRTPTPIASSPSDVSYQPAPWSRSQLEKERQAFFDTRVSGNDEVWKAVRVVSDLVRRGEMTEAQGILDALNITCPTGRIAAGRSNSMGRREKGGLYDDRGFRYDIPAWVLIDPQDTTEDEKQDEDALAVDENKEEEDAAGAARRREEKGKGRAEDPGETVILRARLSDRGTDVKVKVGNKEKISVAVKHIQEQIGSKRIRLMYLGKTLDERSTLMECGWKQGHVVNAMVFEGDEKMLSKT